MDLNIIFLTEISVCRIRCIGYLCIFTDNYKWLNYYYHYLVKILSWKYKFYLEIKTLKNNGTLEILYKLKITL